jgi:hypothetical protein
MEFFERSNWKVTSSEENKLVVVSVKKENIFDIYHTINKKKLNKPKKILITKLV